MTSHGGHSWLHAFTQLPCTLIVWIYKSDPNLCFRHFLGHGVLLQQQESNYHTNSWVAVVCIAWLCRGRIYCTTGTLTSWWLVPRATLGLVTLCPKLISQPYNVLWVFQKAIEVIRHPVLRPLILNRNKKEKTDRARCFPSLEQTWGRVAFRGLVCFLQCTVVLNKLFAQWLSS